MELIRSTENVYRLFEAEEGDDAVSDALSRDTFRTSTVYINNTGAVPVTVEVSPGYGIWMAIQDPVVDPTAIVHIELNIKYLRVTRGVGAGAVDAVVMSGERSHS